MLEVRELGWPRCAAPVSLVLEIPENREGFPAKPGCLWRSRAVVGRDLVDHCHSCRAQGHFLLSQVDPGHSQISRAQFLREFQPKFSGNSSPVPPQGREEAPLLTRPHSKDKSQPSLPELESHREHLPERSFPTHLDWGFARKPGVPSWWQGTNPNVPELCCHPLKGSHLLPGSGMGDLGRGSHFPVSRAILNVSPLPQPRRSQPAPQPRCSSIQPPPCPAMSLGGRDIPRS